jgi:hypothetical protein
MSSNLLKLAPAVMLAGAATLGAPMAASAQTTIFAEDFECVKLLPRVDENGANAAAFGTTPVFTHVPPFGWLVDASGVAGAGTEEWRGWSFARKDFWIACDNQTRSDFVLGQGVVAIADPDEYDDVRGGIPDDGYFGTFMRTPAISLRNVQSSSVTLTFDSSWRPEGFDDGNEPQDNNQTAIIRASFNGGATFTEILRWDSDVLGTFFKPDAQNETVNVNVPIPSGSTSVIFEFAMELARNDWWWAVDNIRVTAAQSNARSVSGSIALEGATITAPTEAAVTIRDVSNVLPDLNTVVCTDASGNFIIRNLPPANYRIKVKTAKNLSRVVAANTTAGNVSGVAVPVLKAGDVNNDDAADITDLLALIGAYNQVRPAAGYLEAADFNNDGNNDITDLLALIANYNQEGETL